MTSLSNERYRRITLPLEGVRDTTVMEGLHLSLFCDASLPWQLGLQDPATMTAEGISDLHDTLSFYLLLILVGVTWVLASTLQSRPSISHKYLTHGTVLELVWTVTPALVLIALAFPSFRLLYLLDSLPLAAITVKVVGHQWFWSYQLCDYEPLIEFDSYLVGDEDLKEGDLRLLAVDNPLVLPVGTHVRFIITATDVIHDFAVPSLGLKVDAVPGRLNEGSALIQREGTFYGQCSELCGVLHGFMPICVEGVSLDRYLAWLDARSE